MSSEDSDAAALAEQLVWERRSRELLQSIAVAAAESVTWRAVAQRAVHEICVSTGWPVGHVFVRDGDGSLCSAGIWHLDDPERFRTLRELSERARFPAGRGLPGRVMAAARPLWIRDVTVDTNFPRAQLARDLGVHAAFGFPVLVRGDVYAVLEFFSPEIAEPRAPFLDVMGTVGSQLGRVVERTRADEALRSSELRFRSVAQTANDAIISANADGEIVFWNRRAAIMFGYDEAEALGRSLTLIIPERLRQRHTAGLARMAAGGEPRVIGRTTELIGLRRDGSEFPLELTLATWTIGDAAYYTGILRDITERKEVEQQLRSVAARLQESEQAAVQASRAKSIFLANMSHELRTPLNAILGFVQLLLRDRTLGASQRDSLDVIMRSGEHLLGLINDILTLSKVEAGEASLQPSHFDARRLLGGLRDLFQLRAEARGLELTVAASPAFPAWVTGDEGKLRQVLINLVGNAVKFTERGSVRVQAGWLAGRASFAVEDTGVGIAPHEIARLFAPFVQTSAGEQAHEGTGLGLAISRDFVRLMGGELHVDSTLGQGTRFAFSIALPEAMAAADAPAARVVGLAPGQRALRVLVVDNAVDNRRLLARLLESVGFLVREAGDGRAGVAAWQEWAPDVVWMDMRMPVMNGYEATRAIRAAEGEARRTVIIALTASAFEHGRDAILAVGCDEILLKPFHERSIFELLARLAGVRFAHDEPAAPAAPPRAPSLDRLANLPREWQTELARALAEGDDLQTQRMVERIGAVDAALAGELGRMVRAFQLDELLGLLERVPAVPS